MIKIYGMPSCPYCEYVQKQIVGREDENSLTSAHISEI